MRTRISLAAVAIVLAMPAQAVTITIKQLGTGMPPAVFVTGDFEYGDDERFQNMTVSLPQAIVSFNSPGGNAFAGMTMGAIIREKAFTTYVGRGWMCASACAMAWLGGSKRAMSAGAQIGFHAAYRKTGYGTTEDSGQVNAVAGAYVTRLGLPVEAVAYVTRASGPNNLEWLTAESARRVGIAVEIFESSGMPVTPAAYAPLMPSGSLVPAQPAYNPQPAYPAPAPQRDDGWVQYPHGDGYMPEPQQPTYAPQPYAPPVYVPPPVVYVAGTSLSRLLHREPPLRDAAVCGAGWLPLRRTAWRLPALNLYCSARFHSARCRSRSARPFNPAVGSMP